MTNSDFRLGTQRNFKHELSELLARHDLRFIDDRLKGLDYFLYNKGKNKKKITTELFLDLSNHGFQFFQSKHWIVIS